METMYSRKLLLWVLGVILLIFLFYFFLLSAPANFPEGVVFTVDEGSTLRRVSLNLKNARIIRSRAVFEAFVILYSGDRHIISADYLFEGKISAASVARRISKGERHLAPVKLTIPEGFTVPEIAEIAALNLAHFNKDKFLLAAKDKEGYLFPDTYFFLTNAAEEDVIRSLSDNFKKKILTLEKDIVGSGKSETDIVKMASVIEKESKGDQDRDLISGILWKRISIGMPIQADAAPETYESKGLPKKPIANPGLSSIKAAIYPKSSPYLYYLHDKEGTIHFAKSFAEHRKNIEIYLK